MGESDVLWDLGCGDGRILVEAARQVGCRCVGVDIDKACVADARRLAAEANVAHLCTFLTGDALKIAEQGLTNACASPASAFMFDEDSVCPESLPRPTAIVLYVTGTMLCALSGWLRAEWEHLTPAVRIATCVDALDTAVDYRDDAALFDKANPHGWEVSRADAHARYGIYVVPNRLTSVAEWEEALAPRLDELL